MRGSDGNDKIEFSNVMQIEGYISENKGTGKVPCGDCKDGVYNPAPLPPPLSATSTKSQQQLELEAKLAFEDAAAFYVRMLCLDQEPLENESMVLEWLSDKLKNKLPIGPLGTVLDSLEPTLGGSLNSIKPRTRQK